ncbi:AAA family ATPase [Candidatus Peregrinibacteria bacterium]|nr:AAA family ATPase [Candidatus Peregrinibacteria bacterium]
MTQLLYNLNEMQKDAVLTNQGPVLVLAGAGSGKTKALTTRIAYLIQEKGISPWNILAVTFTNKAANEMKSRILEMLGRADDDSAIPNVGTFHSICVRILRKHIHELGYDNSFVIYDTTDQQILMKRVLEELQLDAKQFNPKAILNFISNAKNQLIGPNKYYQFVNNYFTEKVEKAYKVYQRELQKNNALDFDDIIMKTVELFRTNTEILDKYQEQFKFISVDEYQDTNHAQYVLTNLLAEKYRNLCVIGDSDQSIYSFRGANIQNILDFEKDYPDAKVILLEQNYRSTQLILDAAHAIIEKNTRRKEKKLWTEQAHGSKIIVKELYNERQEGEYIAEEIIQSLKNNISENYNDFVVLYRTNAQSRVIEEAMLRFSIPYKIIGGIKFYERKEIKDIISYLRAIQNPNDSISLLRIINTPARKIGKKTVDTIQNYAIRNSTTFWQALEQIDQIEAIRGAKNKALEDFKALISELQVKNRENAVGPLIKHVLELTGYKKFVDDGSVEGESRMQNIHELISVASKYNKLDPGESLSIFLEEISLITDLDNLDQSDNAVTLMTIHSAKGLEFKNVFIAGLEDGIFPHSRSLLEREELEEERRLMYVAVTRAMEKLYLLHAANRMLYGESQANPPSQFIIDIPEELIERYSPRMHQQISETKLIPDESPHLENSDGFYEEPVYNPDQELKEGDRVHHTSFGEGTIISIRGGVATICFKSKKHGIKKLALSIAPLKKL